MIETLNNNLEFINGYIPSDKPKIIGIERFKSGASFINDVFMCTTRTGEQYVIKIANPNWPRVKTLNEVLSIKIVRQKTTIPTPNVLGYCLDKENPIQHEFIIMDMMEGVPLSLVYDDIKNTHNFEKILDNLADYISQLRKIPYEEIGNFTLDEDRGIRVMSPIEIYSPSDLKAPMSFAEYYLRILSYYRRVISKSDFLNDVDKESLKKYIDNVIELLKTRRFSKESFVFSHQDFVMKNILVKGEKVVGIVDWEWAGPNIFEMESLSGFDFLEKKEHRAHFKARLKNLKCRIFLEKAHSLRQKIIEFSGLIYRIASFEEWIGKKPFLHTARLIKDKLFQRWVKGNKMNDSKTIKSIILKDIHAKHANLHPQE